MRLHRLVITGVGPFRDRQEIDFDELADSGLFLIDGATGSGKTTIIDSIVYALFGVVSGADSDPGRMRSNLCGDDDPTGVACDFSVDGRRHLITRVPAHVRDPEEPGKAAKSKGARQTLTEYGPDGAELRILTANREIAEHVHQLLAMSEQQFRQLVVLPQGQFADLLRQTPNERLNSLAPLLGDEFFAKVQDDLRRNGDAAHQKREAAQASVQKAAQQLVGRLRVYIDGADTPPDTDFTDAAATDEARRTAVEAIMADLGAQAANAAHARDEQAVTTQATRDAATAARDVADALRQVGDAQQAVADAEALLDPVDAGIAETDVPARIGAQTRLEGSLVDHAAWESQSPERAAARALLAAREAECRHQAAELRSEKDAIPAAQGTLEHSRDAHQRLAGTAETAGRELERLSALVATAGERRLLVPELEALAKALAAAEADAAQAANAALDAGSTWEDLVERQRGERVAELASTLEPGAECPVCGSTEHPRPAHPPSGATLTTDADVELAKRTASLARETASAATLATAQARDSWQECESRVSVLTGALGDRSDTEVEEAHTRALAAQTAADEAIAALPAIQAALDDLADREGALDADIAGLDTEAATVAGTVTALETAEHQRAAQIGLAIGDAASATELLASTRARIASLSALQEAQAALSTAAAAVPADQRHLPLADADALAASTALHHQEAAAVLAEVTELATSLATAIADATPLAGRFSEALAHRRRVDEDTHAAVTLAALVSAANPKRLQLRSYALQRRFEAVLVAASIHLERMSSGKFAFELSDQTARAGQSGLGIAVLDTWTGHLQDPKSLSGGETFYASLSLALGLADVVRGEAGGSALETLFVDEGFGSLDQDTLYQVLDQLEQLRSGRRAVGVVSHVTEMKESIPDRIEVRRQPDRSSTIVRPSTDAST